MNHINEYGRHFCQMPGCSVEVAPGEKYCVACEWVKERVLTGVWPA